MKVLKLHSPLGVKPISYTWPLTSNCEYDKSTVPAIIQTMEWVCYDYPEIKFALQNNILADYDINSYESMKNVCNRFNKVIDTLTNLEKGTSLQQKRVKKQASRDLLRHIMQQVYIRAVDDPRKLNNYKPFSPEVYGETSYDYVCQIIDSIQATPQDVFIDLGSGVGQVVLQMAASTPCKLCIGIERAKNPNMFALKMEKYFQEWMAWFGKKYGNYELIPGNFLDEKFERKIRHCSIFFTNNILFGPYINNCLQERFSLAKDGTKIVSSRNFCQRNLQVSNRNENDIGRIMTVVQLPAMSDSVSWTGKPFSFYLHVIDRTKQHEIGKRRSVPVKEKEDYHEELHENSRRTLVKQSYRPKSVPITEMEEYYPELNQTSRKTFVKQIIQRPRSVPPKEKEEYSGLGQKIDRPRSGRKSKRILLKKNIDKPRSVPVKEKVEHHGKLVRKSQTILLDHISNRLRSASTKEKQEYHPMIMKNSSAKDMEEHQAKLVQNSRITLVKKKIGIPKPAPIKGKKEYHPQLVQTVEGMFLKKIDRSVKSIASDENHKSILKTSVNKLENSNKDSSRCYGNTTRYLNKSPKKVNFLKTVKDKINKPAIHISEEFDHLNYSDSENTSSLELNDTESVVSVDSFSNNENAIFQTNIVRPNVPTPLNKNQRGLNKESQLAKKLALLKKKVNQQRIHRMELRKNTIRQSVAISKRLNNYLSNKIKQYTAIITKNNQNDLKLNHTNNSKIVKRIITQTEYPKTNISPKLYTATEIVRPKTPTRIVPTAEHTENIRPETYRQIIRSKISTGNTTERVRLKTPTRMVPTEIVRSERGHTKTICPEIDIKIVRPEIATKVKCPDISTRIEPTEIERPEIPSGMVCTEKRPEMVHPELSKKNISPGISSITNLAIIELNDYCKQFQKMVENRTINKNEIVAFRDAVNEIIDKKLEQDAETNETLQRNCQTKETTDKINFAKRMKKRDMRNLLKRKLFRNSNQIKKVTPKRKLQRKLLSKIKDTCYDQIPQKKIYEDDDDNISVSSVASPEFTPFGKEDFDFFKRFFQFNKRKTL